MDARQLPHEPDGRGVDSEDVEGARPLGVAVERLEIQADVVDGAGGDRQVVALFPDVPSSSVTEPRKGFAIRRIISPPTSALPMPRASVFAATRGGLAVAVILGEKAVDDARAEEKAVVRSLSRPPLERPMRMTWRSTFARGRAPVPRTRE